MIRLYKILIQLRYSNDIRVCEEKSVKADLL